MARTTINTFQVDPSQYRWMRWTYGCTAFLGLIAGGVMLGAPEKFARKFVGFPFRLPPVEPITFGALGSLWFAFGILSLLGLRAPLRFLPLFLMQLTYKLVWFGAVFFPLWISHSFPNWGWALTVGNAAWIAMDLRSIPWQILLAKDESEPITLPYRFDTREDLLTEGVASLYQSERRAA